MRVLEIRNDALLYLKRGGEKGRQEAERESVRDKFYKLSEQGNYSSLQIM